MTTAEIINRIDEIISDYAENLQYDDDESVEWRNNCIKALKEAKVRLQKEESK